ncbi:hypothetical protein WPS_31810 [Vulcanimicrobium alpinum]|uniref:Protein PsiE n=1 Tax=Vulcanimicrobium alpinum TaxID=3016050 RepID=A0AAN2CAQ1_UNVUL|nr:phosphate-starvation-inducible PsiE family protein [Vulcanimicrobium alpinum]BDE07905.1 hypothetical protein WPS_31810 [Vulcanimicrobium alpinum]
MVRRSGTTPSKPEIEHTNVHEALSRYFEWAQDAVAAALALVVIVVMVQGIWTLARLALVDGREPRIVLPQIVLLLILVELFRTLLFYLREHRVAVGLMIEVAIVSLLRELLVNPPGAKGTMSLSAYGIALLLVVLGALMVADRMTSSGAADAPGRSTVAEE